MEIRIGDTVVTTKHTRHFSESNHNWCPNAAYNEMFLRSQHAYFVDRLQSRGHLFLNEIFDALGFARTVDGAVMGYTKTDANGQLFKVREFDGTIFVDFEVEEIWNKI